MHLTIKKYKNDKITCSKLGLVYILSMTIAEVHQSGLFSWYYLTAILIGVFWAGVGFVKYLKVGIQTQEHKQLKKVMFLLIFPRIVFFVYNIIIYAMGIGYTPFIKSSFIQSVFSPCILLGGFGAYYLFGKKTLRYFLYSVALTYFISLSVLMIRLGPVSFVQGIFSVITRIDAINPFEQNSDMVLSLGLLLIFYLNSFIKTKSKEIGHASIIFILVILGGKRIEILALVVIGCAIKFTKLMAERKRNILQMIVSIIMIGFMFFFVYLVISGWLSFYLYSQNINTMGRIKMWDYVAQYAEFNPLYMGKGASFSNLILEANKVLTYNGKVYVLHSDVLKIFFDYGFFMFVFWTIYYLIFIPHKCRLKFGYEMSNLMWSLMIFLFALYFTDNAFDYFIVQNVLVIVILQGIMRKSENLKIEKVKNLEE